MRQGLVLGVPILLPNAVLRVSRPELPREQLDQCLTSPSADIDALRPDLATVDGEIPDLPESDRARLAKPLCRKLQVCLVEGLDLPSDQATQGVRKHGRVLRRRDVELDGTSRVQRVHEPTSPYRVFTPDFAEARVTQDQIGEPFVAELV